MPSVDNLFPAVDGLAGALGRGLFTPLSAAIAIYYAIRVLKRTSFVVVALLILGACGAGASAYTPAEFFFGWGGFLLSAGFTAAALVWLYRDNVVAYVLTGFLTESIEGALRLLEQPAPAYIQQGWIWLGVTAAVVIFLGVLAVRTPRNPPGL